MPLGCQSVTDLSFCVRKLLPKKTHHRLIATGIALAALAAFAVGLLSVLGTTGVADMGILNRITWHYGALLMTAGVLLLISTLRLPCLVFSPTLPKRVMRNNEMDDQAEKAAGAYDEKADLPNPPEDLFLSVLKFFNISPASLKEHLESIYGEKIPKIERRPRSSSPEDVASYKQILMLHVLKNERLPTFLTLDLIATFEGDVLKVLQKRLLLCPPTAQPTKEWGELDTDPETITLADLWSVRGDTILDNAPDCMQDPLWGLLTSAQLNQLLEKERDEQLLGQLFPTQTPSAKKWTAYRFQHLSVEYLKQQLKNLTTAQLHLLPTHYVLCDEFPRDKALSEGGNFVFFSVFGERAKATQDIFDRMIFTKIVEILPYLDIAQCTAIPKKHWQEEKFPWDVVLRKRDFAHGLRLLPLAKLPGVPWKEIVKNPQHIQIIFSLKEEVSDGKYGKRRSVKLLNTLPLGVICTVAPALSARHLREFEKKRLKDPDFPWDIFVEKKGMGQEMRFLTDASEVLLAANIPWEKLTYARNEQGLIRKPDLVVSDGEVKELFSFFEGLGRDKLTDQLLNKLRIDQIAALAPALSKEHLRHFKRKRLLDPAFPWKAFLEKSGIGLEMRRLHDSKAKAKAPDILAAACLPWEWCIKNQPTVINDLLIIHDPLYPKGTEEILNALKIKTIKIITPLLTQEHLALLGDERFAEEEFPWNLILSKEKIGQLVRTLFLKEIALKNFDWATFAENRAEIDKFFSTHEFKKDNTRTILNSLQLEVIKFLAQKGVLTEACHYALLDSDRKIAFKEALS